VLYKRVTGITVPQRYGNIIPHHPRLAVKRDGANLTELFVFKNL
jgi:hypothetical protein